jgi:hypothetical protein
MMLRVPVPYTLNSKIRLLGTGTGAEQCESLLGTGTEQCSGPGSWAIGSWPPGSVITIFVQIRILPSKLKTLLSTVFDFLILFS